MHQPLIVKIKKRLQFKPRQSMHIFNSIQREKQSTLNIHNNQQDNIRICMMLNHIEMRRYEFHLTTPREIPLKKNCLSSSEVCHLPKITQQSQQAPSFSLTRHDEPDELPLSFYFLISSLFLSSSSIFFFSLCWKSFMKTSHSSFQNH